MATATMALPNAPLRYTAPIEAELDYLVASFATMPGLAVYPARWLAIQLLEGDETLLAEAEQLAGPALTEALEASMARLQPHYGDELDVALVDQRYRFVHALAGKSLTRPAVPPLTLSDRIDQVVTHRWLGIPIFLMLMWLVFTLTTEVAGPFVDWVDDVIAGPLSGWATALLSLVGLGETWVEGLVVDGMLAGMGGVLVFVPVLLSLYFALALLEDSGYMARAAFVMDRLMHSLGLHGKSFLPMIVGFGCTVPAIYATRTLDSQRDRILTGLLVPFMSCGARLPVYVLIAAIFFPAQAGMVIFGLYVTGIVVAIGSGMLLRQTVFRGQPAAPFVLELPPYRLPTPRGVWNQMWERTAAFVRKAWTIILGTSVVVWLLLAIPVRGEGSFADAPLEDSAFATLAGGVTPIFAPLGFGSWETSGALMTGFVAKEVVVATLIQTYAVDEEEEAHEATSFGEDVLGIVGGFLAATGDALLAIPGIIGFDLAGDEEEEATPSGLRGAIERGFAASSGGHSALAALAFLVFVLLYTPCMVAVAAARHEFGPRWMWFSIVGQFVIAWLGALIVFQGGKLLGL
ncbi:ferrous iron transport protein B [Candidatus Viridilinea mediisalina]|uniref:Ferrous iron transport protein B n=1 Tax=Candidatus Viridilinea mediisalina TaxID=2024553 RepID=A0A2A6RIP3_9CHLR|nr:ferrous iron transport protein B [Candidatus Viridilinea mediisalina]PDW02811.1 ferrous iron transport protein B [Candidatus Viridilinea mediisalina]